MDRPLPPLIDSLHHVAIPVLDLATCATFYRKIVGLRELEVPEAVGRAGICWFDLGQDRALHLFTADVLHESRAHFAVTVSDVDAWRAHFRHHGVAFVEPRVKLYGADRVFVRDPADNLVEFVNWGGARGDKWHLDSPDLQQR